MTTLANSDSEPMNVAGDPDRRRLAVLGLGANGIEFAAAVARDPACELAGLLDARGDLRHFAKGCGFVAPILAALPRLLERGPLDGVIVCAPPADTPVLVVRAIAAGLAVLVPGAPAADAAGAASVTQALRSSQRPMLSSLGALTHPLFTRAQHALESGVLGRVQEIRASVQVSRVFGPASLPPFGDVLDHVALNLVVLLDRWFGPVASVVARGQRLYGDRLDEVRVMLTLTDGTQVSFDGSWSVPGYPRAAMVVEIECEHGRVLASDDALELQRDEQPEPERVVLAGLAEGHALEWGEAHAALQRFTHSLSLAPEVADVQELLRALRAVGVLQAIRASAAADGAAVPVDA